MDIAWMVHFIEMAPRILIGIGLLFLSVYAVSLLVAWYRCVVAGNENLRKLQRRRPDQWSL